MSPSFIIRTLIPLKKFTPIRFTIFPSKHFSILYAQCVWPTHFARLLTKRMEHQRLSLVSPGISFYPLCTRPLCAIVNAL